MLLELTWASFATRAVVARLLLRVIRPRSFSTEWKTSCARPNPLRARGYQLSGQSAVHLCALPSSLSADPIPASATIAIAGSCQPGAAVRAIPVRLARSGLPTSRAWHLRVCRRRKAARAGSHADSISGWPPGLQRGHEVSCGGGRDNTKSSVETRPRLRAEVRRTDTSPPDPGSHKMR
jgi:hypothetical protein